MTATSLYTKTYHVDLRDIDFTKKLKLSALFTYFQDIASEAAEKLGFGIIELEEKFGVAWVLVKLKLEIERIPELDEEIFIETWPLQPKRVEFERDFIVKDRHGELIMKAISTWVIMDMKERKLRRAELIGITYPETITTRAIATPLKKLKNIGELESAYKKVIGYSDIDFNGHLNNSRYVDYMMDCFPVDNHLHHEVKSLEVHFVHEALPGETVILKKDTSKITANIIYIEGVKEATNETVFKSEVVIVPK